MAFTNRIDRFLKLMNDRGASDLHLSVGRPPMFRLSGLMDPIRYRILTDNDFTQLLAPVVSEQQWSSFQETGDLDLAYEVTGVARFRVNLFRQERGYGAVFRIIPTNIMTFQQLGLPKSVERFCYLRNGLMLVTGPTGSGKSTTLAAIIDKMNAEQNLHVITIEDPIEFTHEHKRSIISQREIGMHANDFAESVRAAMREDPDVILVGEMRDLETIRTALNAAEAGFTVFGTLHTNNAAKAVDRMINVFPEDEQENVRGALAESLRGVVAQQLLRRKQGGRVAAVEVLFATSGIATLIRDGKTAQLNGAVQLGKTQGMIAMDDALMNLYRDNIVHANAAYEKAVDKAAFWEKLQSYGEVVEEPEAEQQQAAS